jgi:hypothetical protein
MMVAETIGAPFSEEKLRKSGCEYLSVDGTPLYRDLDLEALSQSILDRALKRGRPRPTTQYEKEPEPQLEP